MRFDLDKIILGALVVVIILSSCTKHEDSAPTGDAGGGGLTTIVTGGSEVKMSPKPPIYGFVTGPNYSRALAVATSVDQLLDPGVSKLYPQIQNNLSPAGGMTASGPMYQAEDDLAAQYAVAAVTADALKPISDATRLVSIDLTVGFTTAGGADTFTTAVVRSLAASLVLKLTGVPATQAQIDSLSKTMTNLRATVPNTAAGKQLVVEMAMTIILVGEHAYRL